MTKSKRRESKRGIRLSNQLCSRKMTISQSRFLVARAGATKARTKRTKISKVVRKVRSRIVANSHPQRERKRAKRAKRRRGGKMDQGSQALKMKRRGNTLE